MQRLVMLSVALSALLILSPVAFSQSFTDKAKKDRAVDMSDEDPAMQKAMERARAGLEDFLRKAGAPPPNTDQYSVKVRVSEGDNQEYLWVSNLKSQGIFGLDGSTTSRCFVQSRRDNLTHSPRRRSSIGLI